MATTTWFGLGMKAVQSGAIDLDTDTFKIMLTDNTYTPDQDAHDFRNDVTGEITGTGYSAGGLTLTGVSLTYDGTSNEIRLDWSTDPSWSSATFTAYKAVIYKSRGGASSADELLCWIDFGGAQTVTAGTFTIQFAATGVLKTTV